MRKWESSKRIKTGIPEGQEAYDAACELADAGCNFVFADSFGHEDYIIEAAREFPDDSSVTQPEPKHIRKDLTTSTMLSLRFL